MALGPHPWQVRVSPAPSSYSQPEMPAETKVPRPGEAGQPGAGVPPLPGLCSITAGAPTDPLLTLLLRGLPGSPLLLGVSPWILVGLRSGRRCRLVPRSQALCWGVPTTVTAPGTPLMPPHVTAPGGRCRAAVPPRSQHRSLVALPLPTLPCQPWGQGHQGMGVPGELETRAPSRAGGHGGSLPCPAGWVLGANPER